MYAVYTYVVLHVRSPKNNGRCSKNEPRLFVVGASPSATIQFNSSFKFQ